MTVNYVVTDNQGNAGQTIPLTQGESRLINLFLFNSNGTPFVIPGTISTIVLKIFSTINGASIQKTLAGTTVAAITTAAGIKAGLMGFSFSLLAADTTSMAANNSGLPMTATVTDTSANITELDFISMFNVVPPAVLT
jgi:hypothetical protein